MVENDQAKHNTLWTSIFSVTTATLGGLLGAYLTEPLESALKLVVDPETVDSIFSDKSLSGAAVGLASYFGARKGAQLGVWLADTYTGDPELTRKHSLGTTARYSVTGALVGGLTAIGPFLGTLTGLTEGMNVVLESIINVAGYGAAATFPFLGAYLGVKFSETYRAAEDKILGKDNRDAKLATKGDIRRAMNEFVDYFAKQDQMEDLALTAKEEKGAVVLEAETAAKNMQQKGPALAT